MDGVALVREYYRSIDDGAYDALTRLLSEGFIHRRPDATIEGREEFISFMKHDRPKLETTHVIESLFVESGGETVAAEGRLLEADGEEWFRFVDTFGIDASKIERVRTYTDLSPE